MTPPSSPRAGRSTVSAAGEPRLSFGEILSVVGEWWDGCARADHAVGINLSNPGYRQAVFEGLARLIHSKAGAAASPTGPEAVPQSEPPDPLATVHVVEFTEDGYGLQHPASCRPNLIDCRYNTYLTSLFQPEREPGRYVMTLAGEHAEYTPVAEVGAVPQSEREGLPSEPLMICNALSQWAEVADVSSPRAGTGRLAIAKSDLLARLIYGGERGPSKTPCPVHNGRWSGCHFGWPGSSEVDQGLQDWWDAGCRCATHRGSNCTTGWNPDEHCGCALASPAHPDEE